MKAIVHTKYESSDDLPLNEVEKPTPKDNDVRTIIYAAIVTAGDCCVSGSTAIEEGTS